MLYTTSQILQEFAYPLNVALLLLLFAGFLRWRGRPRGAWLAGSASFLILYIAGTTAAIDPLLMRMEAFAPPRAIAQYENADAIVVLGGSVNPSRWPRLGPEELGGARLACGVRLFRAGKAPLVVAAGGLPYFDADGHERSEADDIAELLVDLGVPATVILKENRSRNTYENAVYTRELLAGRQVRRILLVTNALHLRRATALFAAQGFEVIPVPNSYLAVTPKYRWDIRMFLPNPLTLVRATYLVKEAIGFAAYRAMGKL